jgi:hypothetical protein
MPRPLLCSLLTVCLVAPLSAQDAGLQPACRTPAPLARPLAPGDRGYIVSFREGVDPLRELS